MKRHRYIRNLSLLLTTLVLAALVANQTFKEDIADFLPSSSHFQQAQQVYQHISGADRIFVLFQLKDTTQTDPEVLMQAVDRFTELLAEADTTGMVRRIVSKVDLDQIASMGDFVYRHIPYFLTDGDFDRMDSLLQKADYVAHQVAEQRQMLLLPGSGLMATTVQHDPLNLFGPVMERMQNIHSGLNYEQEDGYLFTPDMKTAIVIVESAFGGSETENNARLTALLESVVSSFIFHPSFSISLTGGPVIAVENATQIKHDSMVAISLAIVLILALLLYVFRRVWNILLILLSIAWGWLFAMGIMVLMRHEVSMIVIGISSVILGIAVNYPLHLIAHLRHTPDIRQALREIVMPLVVGNITTVGAFLALVPLQSVALRDLGIFSSLLLVGTILFVLLFLPHYVRPVQGSGLRVQGSGFWVQS